MGKFKAKAFKDLLQSFRRPVQNEKGIAMLIAVACLLLITYIAIEVTYDTNIEYAVNANGLTRLKAYYAAKAGVDIGLLRVKVFQKVLASPAGKALGSNADMIWNFPFAWPLPVPPDLNAVDKDMINKLQKESLMDGSYFLTIEDEGSKIDLNDLNSPSKTLRDSTRQQILGIFAQKMKNDQDFSQKFSGTRFEDLVDAIQGWGSPISKMENGQDKRQAYREMNNRVGSEYFPPNRPFRTVAELRMVPGVTDEIYDILEPLLTVSGMKGINPNIASKEILKSLDEGMTDEVVVELVKRRDDKELGGPYKDANDFWTYAKNKGAQIQGDTTKVPLIFDNIMNFRIRSTGQFGNISSEITAIVMDYAQTAGKIKTAYGKDQQSQQNQQNSPATTPPTNPPASTANKPATASDGSSKGAPRIVYWSEK